MSALEGVSGDEFELKWLGWAGAVPDYPEEQQQLDQRLLEEFGCCSVFLSAEEVEAYYDGFSNGSLWPILHYNPHLMEYDGVQWDIYKQVNRKFAARILELAGDDDLVWVHDYHLMLVPVKGHVALN